MLQHIFNKKITQQRHQPTSMVAAVRALLLLFTAVGFVACQKDLQEMVTQPSGQSLPVSRSNASAGYSKYFKEYLQNNFNTTTAVVYSLEINNYENAETASFEFKSPVNNKRETVMYITPIGPNGQKGGPVVEVDCTGSCNTPEETCRERYNLSTGTAECTCEGDCKMTVKYKDEN